jgi:hypothetical protein
VLFLVGIREAVVPETRRGVVLGGSRCRGRVAKGGREGSTGSTFGGEEARLVTRSRGADYRFRQGNPAAGGDLRLYGGPAVSRHVTR